MKKTDHEQLIKRLQQKTRALEEEIRERRRAERDLRESEKKYRDLFTHTHDAIFIVQDEFIRFFNPMTEKLLGYSAEEIRSIPFFRFIHADDRYRIYRKYRQRLRGRDIASTSRLRIVPKNGEPIWIHINSVRITWEEQPATLTFARDITLEKNLENQLQHARKMEAIGILAGGIAHDFNNILSTINGYAELTLLQLDKKSQAHANLTRVIQAGNRARELARQMLNFSREETSDYTPVTVTPIVKETVKLIRGTLPSPIQVHLHIEVSNDLVLGDAIQIHQILMNLCTNARHAMDEEGGILDISLDNIRLRKKTTMGFFQPGPGNYLRLTVQDSGHGIPDDILDKIFDPYFTTKRKNRGTGLGLSIVHGIVKGLDGAVTAANRTGSGAVFTVLFPVIDERRTRKRKSDRPSLRGSGNLLLVDNEPFTADTCAEMIESLGYQVKIATSGNEALALFRSNSGEFDLVLTDYAMPQMGGIELADRLLRLRPEIPILLYSGYCDDLLPENVKKHGIREILPKPLTKRDLSEILRRYL